MKRKLTAILLASMLAGVLLAGCGGNNAGTQNSPAADNAGSAVSEAGSGTDAVNAIEDLLPKKAVALCIDVRGNEGGLAQEVAILLDYLLPSGEMFSQVDKEGHRNVSRSDAMSLQLPMVVLIDSRSYGEAELFGAVLQENNWAILMGEATSGMTRTQETFELDDGSAVRLSTKSYITAKGTDLSLAGGVIPDTIIHNSDPNTVGTTEGLKYLS